MSYESKLSCMSKLFRPLLDDPQPLLSFISSYVELLQVTTLLDTVLTLTLTLTLTLISDLLSYLI